MPKSKPSRLNSLPELSESVLSNLPIGIAVNRISNGEVLFINAHFSEIYGWPQEEIWDVETFFEKAYPDPGYRKAIKERVLADIASGDPKRMVWNGIEVTTSRGEKRIVDAQNIPIPEHDLMISTVRDNTESEQNRKVLSEMNQRYKLVSKATSDTIYDCDFEKQELHWSENYVLHFGKPAKNDPKYAFANRLERLHSEDREVVQNNLARILEGNSQFWRQEYRLRHETKDQYLSVSDRGYILRDDSGKAVRLIGALENISPKYQSKQRLELFESSIKNTKDAILMTEVSTNGDAKQLKIIYANHAFKRLTGYRAKEILGGSAEFLYGPLTDQDLLVKTWERLWGKESQDEELILYRKDGEPFWAELSISPLLNEKGQLTHSITLIRDASQKHARLENGELISKISRISASTEDLSAMLGKVAIAIASLTHTSMAEVWLVDPEQTKISLIATSITNKKIKKHFGLDNHDWSFEKGQGLPGKIWASGRIQIFSNPSRPRSHFIRKELVDTHGIRAAFGIPLLSGSNLVGAVLVLSTDHSNYRMNQIRSRLEGVDLFLGTEIQRKHALKELNTLVHSVPDIICRIKDDGQIITVNESVLKILGYQPQELLGKHVAEFMHPGDRERGFRADAQPKNLQKVHFLQVRFLHKSGATVWMEWTVSAPLADGIQICVGRNVSEWWNQREELRLTKERLQKASEATNDAIWEWNRSTGRLIWMDGFLRNFGHQPGKELDWEHWKGKVHPSDLPRVIANMSQVLKDPSVSVLKEEYRFRRANGTYAFVVDYANILRDASNEVKGMIGAMQDITDRKNREKELRSLNSSLKAKNKLLTRSNEELEDFAYVASHDLQEPLRMISSFLTQLERKYASEIDERGKLYIHYAVDGAKRMRSKISDLLEYSRLGRQEAKIEEVNLEELLEGVLGLYRNIIEETNAVFEIKDNLPVIQSHRVPLTQVFQNLIDNALKYRNKTERPVIAIGWEDSPKTWKFSVRDNGIGIDAAYHDKIFGLFQRLHESQEYLGSGMGLASAKKILDSLGGNIAVESTPGSGSTFRFSIPKPGKN